MHRGGGSSCYEQRERRLLLSSEGEGTFGVPRGGGGSCCARGGGGPCRAQRGRRLLLSSGGRVKAFADLRGEEALAKHSGGGGSY